MRPTFTREATHNFQKPVNWQPEDGECGDLQVRMETFGPREIIELFSTWKPTDEERKLIAEGGVIEIGICTNNQPPMRVGVVSPVEPALEKFHSHEGVAEVEVPDRSAAITINEDAHGLAADDGTGPDPRSEQDKFADEVKKAAGVYHGPR